jgi:hypothetical protein
MRRGQVLDSSFTCTEGAGGPGIASCVDQNGHVSGSAIDTAHTGSHTFRVTTTSKDGTRGIASVTYKVVARLTKPHISASLGSKSFTATKGTTIKLTLSRAASIKIVVTHSLTGHKVAGVCKTHVKMGKKCTINSQVKTLHFSGAAGSKRFKLRLPTLKPGSYTARVTASDSAGRSNGVTLKFTIRT